MKTKRLSALLLAALILASCSELPPEQTTDAPSETGIAENPAKESTGETVPDPDPETEPAYIYPELDLGGSVLTILNNSTTWGFTTDIIAEELTGETLNDTIYNNNLLIEDKFKVDLQVKEEDINSISTVYLNSVAAGDNAYQMGNMSSKLLSTPDAFKSSFDLRTLNGLNLDSAWWDQDFASSQKQLTGEKLHFGASNINLMTFEDSMCIFMNETMISNHGLEPLYDMVREGTWTFDVLRRYTETAANLNGDDNFAFKVSGNAVYGLTTWTLGVPAMFTGMGNKFTSIDESGTPMLNLENDHFYSCAEKLAAFHGTAGECININGSGEDHYEMVFRAGRSMFTCAQLKASTKYRDMEDTYGIVPLPKSSEEQEAYYSFRTTNVQLNCIPVTNPEPDKTAVVMDAMAYLSYDITLPVYWNVNMEHKQLRNEDSIEMLQIISDTRTFDMGISFGWTTDLWTSIQNTIFSGSSDVASVIARGRKVSEKIIDKYVKVLSEQS